MKYISKSLRHFQSPAILKLKNLPRCFLLVDIGATATHLFCLGSKRSTGNKKMRLKYNWSRDAEYWTGREVRMERNITSVKRTLSIRTADGIQVSPKHCYSHSKSPRVHWSHLGPLVLLGIKPFYLI